MNSERGNGGHPSFTVAQRAEIESSGGFSIKSSEGAVKSSESLIWVYHDLSCKNVRLHRASCPNCQNGVGKYPGARYVDIEWLGFDSYDDAVRFVDRNLGFPIRNCKICEPA